VQSENSLLEKKSSLKLFMNLPRVRANLRHNNNSQDMNSGIAQNLHLLVPFVGQLFSETKV